MVMLVMGFSEQRTNKSNSCRPRSDPHNLNESNNNLDSDDDDDAQQHHDNDYVYNGKDEIAHDNDDDHKVEVVFSLILTLSNSCDMPQFFGC